MKCFKQKLLLVCASCYFFSFPVFAGDAVSERNGKIETLIGNIENTDTKLLGGSFTLPLSSKFGAQGDILAGQINSKTTNGYGVHLFWRDSDKGLFGITASRATYDSNALNRTGLEGEYYFKKATISGQLGRQTGDIASSNYSGLNLSFYPINNLALSLGSNRENGNTKNNIDIEYQTKIKGLSLFANASTGNNDYNHAIGGIRYYFGKQKSLIERHRKDDPPNFLFAGASELARATEERLRAEEAAISTNTGGSGDGDFE